MIKLIAAVGPKNLLGKNNKMPWHIPSEFKHFKDTTMGGTLLMGRITFENLPGKLPGRKTIVLSSQAVKNADKVISVSDLPKLFIAYKNSPEILWIAGGKKVYESFFKEADELIISEVETSAIGNTFLEIDLNNYSKKLIKKETDFKVYSYKRK